MPNCVEYHQPQTAALVICRSCYRALTERTETMTGEDKRTILRNQIALLEREVGDLRARLSTARNELCQHCGKYRMEHTGACDGCRWRGAQGAGEGGG